MSGALHAAGACFDQVGRLVEGRGINVDRWPIAKAVLRTSLLESEELLSNDDVSGNQPLLVVICHDKCMNLRKTRNSFTSL